jgi:hypothetical protein
MTTTMGRAVPLRHERVANWTGAVYAGGVAGVLAAIAVAAGWRGSDLPAQLFRVELLRRNGFVLWDSQWFAGHSTLNYSVLSPVLGALTGPVVLGAVCGVISAILFDRLLRVEFGSAAWFGSLWFAVATVTNLIVGRVTFGLGVTLPLAALRCATISAPSRSCAPVLRSSQADAGLPCIACAGGGSSSVRISAFLHGRDRARARDAGAVPGPGAQPYEWWALISISVVAAFVVLPRVPSAALLRRSAAVLIRDQARRRPRWEREPAQSVRRRPVLACALWVPPAS